MNKTELMENYTMEQLADMAAESEQRKAEIDKLNCKAEKHRKAFEEAKKERDVQICEYKNKIDELKQKLERQETETMYAEEYVLNLKNDIRRKETTINQIDDILNELFGVTHDVVNNPGDFKEILKKKAESYNTIADYLCDEPIAVASTLISAKRSYALTGEEKKRSGLDRGYCLIFDVSDLRQIAEHLLIYCNANGDNE